MRTQDFLRKFGRLSVCLVLIGSLAAAPAFALTAGSVTDPGAEDAASPLDSGSPYITVDMPTQEEIVTYAQEHPSGSVYFDADGYLLGKPHKTVYQTAPVTEGDYQAGQLDDSELVAALNTVKTIRYIAGLTDQVFLYDRYSQLAQASCLVNYVNNKLTHTPDTPAGMDWNLADAGYEGSLKSNLARTSWQENSLKWSILHGWMDDSDANNIGILGHRRWILNPTLGMTGFGSVTGPNGTFSAMYAHDQSNGRADETGICWPAANTPISYFYKTSPWSISIGEKVDPNSIAIVLMRLGDGKTWTFSSFSSDGDFYVNNDNYGQTGCIIFRPEGIEGYEKGDQFIVSIAGLEHDLTYTVSFFDLDGYYAPESPAMNKLKLNEFGDPVITWKSVKDAESYNVYRKAGKNGTWKLIGDELNDTILEDATTGSGIRYYYRVTSLREVNDTWYESQPCDSKYISTKLSTPKWSSLKATARKTNTVRWKKVSGATGYKVYRKLTTSSKWTLVKTTSSLSYKDTKATSGKKYEYRIRAYRTTGGTTVYSSYTTKKSVRTR